MSGNTSKSWRSGFRAPSGLSAEDASEELNRIRSVHGVLTATAVVDESRDETATLHPAFEWDDCVAAEEFRKGQARQLIRSIIVMNVERPEVQHAEFFHVCAEPAGSEYAPYNVVIAQRDLLADATERLKGQLASAQRSLAEIEALATGSNSTGKFKRRITTAGKAIGRAVRAVEAV